MKNKIFCEQLYGGDINPDIKNLIIKKDDYKIKNPQFSRKIIFATEVAESSITIEGLLTVTGIASTSTSISFNSSVNSSSVLFARGLCTMSLI